MDYQAAGISTSNANRKHHDTISPSYGVDTRPSECISPCRSQSTSRFESDRGSETSKLLEWKPNPCQLAAKNLDTSQAALNSYTSSSDKDRSARSLSMGSHWSDQDLLGRTNNEPTYPSQSRCTFEDGFLTAQSEYRLSPIRVFRGEWPQPCADIAQWEKGPLPSPKMILSRMPNFG